MPWPVPEKHFFTLVTIIHILIKLQANFSLDTKNRHAIYRQSLLRIKTLIPYFPVPELGQNLIKIHR